ncbi:MAG: hypothetical protein ABJA98_19310, partial [Acidobacteriota bacterium]
VRQRAEGRSQLVPIDLDRRAGHGYRPPAHRREAGIETQPCAGGSGSGGSVIRIRWRDLPRAQRAIASTSI